MRSDLTLRWWYREINKRFFDGLLPDDVCVRWGSEEEDEEDEFWEQKYFGFAERSQGRHQYVIVLSRPKNTSNTLKLSTLAHEMCHIATGLKDDHGPAFEKWREHIAARGIFKKNALLKGLTLF